VNTHARTLILSAIACGAAACDPGPSFEPIAAINCSAATPWTVGVRYATGALVTFQGSVYQCIQGHTAQSDWPPNAVPALWGLVTCGGGGTPDAGMPPPPPDAPRPDAGQPPPPPDGGPAGTPPGFIFSPYKDTSINMDFNTNTISTLVPGTRTPIATDMRNNQADAITLAFATGECGTENWGGVPGAAIAQVNVPLLNNGGIDYIISTGGAAGRFTCASDAGFATFLNRWASPRLVGVDFDIEAGQSQAEILNLIRRIGPARAARPNLRFSLTIATLGNTDGSESLNATGLAILQAVNTVFGSIPSFVTVNLMVMDYGAPSQFVCFVANGTCDMGRSAIQAAQNLNARHGIPFRNIELTPMIGGNDVQSNVFRLPDVNTMAAFVLQNRLAGVHFWSYDRDIDCPPGPASPVCNSLGGAGPHGFLRRFQAAGL
jgi:chitinase